MFLEGKQITRFDDYEKLGPREKATFTFRIVEKIRTFLDDVTEVNQVLEKIPVKSHKKAFTDEQVCALFDLIEKTIIGLGVIPIMTDPGTGEAVVCGEFQAADGMHYKLTRLATDNEIAVWQKVSTRINRLKETIAEPRQNLKI